VQGCRLTSQLTVGGTQVSERSAREEVRSRLSWWSKSRLNESVARGLECLRNLLLGTESSAGPDSEVYRTVVLESGQTVVEVPQQ
jgi:hypothetical protein